MSTDMTELLKRVLRHLKRHNIGEWHGPPSWDSEQVALVALLEGMMADTTAEPYKNARLRLLLQEGAKGLHKASAYLWPEYKLTSDKLKLQAQAMDAELSGEPTIPESSGKCSVCRRSYAYHIERWGNAYESASMPLEWHPFKGGT